MIFYTFEYFKEIPAPGGSEKNSHGVKGTYNFSLSSPVCSVLWEDTPFPRISAQCGRHFSHLLPHKTNVLWGRIKDGRKEHLSLFPPQLCGGFEKIIQHR